MPHNTNQAEHDNNQIREKLAPFGNAAQIVGTKRVELYDVVRSLLAAEIKAARVAAYEDCGSKGGSGAVVRLYAKHCAATLTGEQPQ